MNFHKFLRISIIFLVIFAWLFSGFPRIWQKPPIPPEIEEVRAAAAQIRQEINIIDAIVTASGDDSAIVQLDATKYNGTITAYLEVVARRASGTLTVGLQETDSASNADSVSVTGASYALYRGTGFTPSGTKYYQINLSGGTTPEVKAARIVIIQNADPLTDTQTQIEIGNKETGKNNTDTLALSNPKYWKYDSSKWDGTQTAYAEVTYRDYQVASSTTWSTAGTYTNGYIVSAGTSYVTVEAWGGGGGGGCNTSGGGGGGGGAYARSTTTPAVGSSHTLVVGVAGTADSTTLHGGDSKYDATTVVAKGGLSTNGQTGVAGGTGSTGDVTANGGTGGTRAATPDTGGGGGGAAGPAGAGGGGQAGQTSVGGIGGAGNNGSGGAGGTPVDGGNGNPGENNPTGGGGGAGSDGTTYGGSGGAPGGGGGGSDQGTCSSSYSQGAAGQIKITETHGKVGIALEKDNGAFGGWAFVQQIVANGTATSSPARVRSDSFSLTDGTHYRLVASTTASTASYDIYNAKIIVDQTASPTKLETQYLLANTLLAAETGLQGFLTKWDSTEWSGVTNVYLHAVDSNAGSSVVEVDTAGGAQIVGSSVTGSSAQVISSSMTMPADGNLDMKATTNNSDVYGSRILVQVGPPPVSLTFIVSTDVFGDVKPEVVKFATSTLNVNTNSADGWYVTLYGNNQGSGTASTTIYLSGPNYNINFTDQEEWIPPSDLATTTAGNAKQISLLDNNQNVLAFKVMTASGTPSFISTAWWGLQDSYVDNADTLWAGIASSTVPRQIGNSSVSSGGGDALNTVLYYLKVPSTQQSGTYTGDLTFTAVTN